MCDCFREGGRGSKYPLLSVDAAIEIILKECDSEQFSKESLSLEKTLGYVVAEDVCATEPQPPFRASIKDGYAVVASDGCGVFDVITSSYAGAPSDKVLKPGQIAYVTTGAPVPDGATAVVMVEDTEVVEDSKVRILKAATEGQDIRNIGCDVAKGEVLIPKNSVVGAAEIGLAASAGVSSLLVHSPPSVAVLSTGDELVATTTTTTTSSSLQGGAIFDSNRPMLLAALDAENIRAIDLGIARDTQEGIGGSLRAAINRADVVITSGGVSMGDLDLVKPYLESVGTVHFGRVLMKPGKPITFATVPRDGGRRPCLVFALPGNPVSALVTLHLFCLPCIRKLSGRTPLAPRVQVVLQSTLKLDPQRPEYHRAIVYWDVAKNSLAASSTGSQDSSRLLSMRAANALLELPKSSGTVESGSKVSAILIGQIAASSPIAVPPAAAAATAAPANQSQRETAAYKEHIHTSEAVVAAKLPSIRVGIITVSDRVSKGEMEDKSTPMAVQCVKTVLESKNQIEITTIVIPDERDLISKAIIEWSDSENCMNLILTCGGTGFAPRDVTPEATAQVLEKQAPSLVTLMLLAGLKATPTAALSRQMAGSRKQSLIINLPGSPKAVRECVEALAPCLHHAIHLLLA